MVENFEIKQTSEEDYSSNETPYLPEKLEENEIVTKKPKTKFFISGGLYSFLLIFGTVFLASLYIFQVFMSPIKVVGKSMQPTINASVLNDSDKDHCDVVYYRKQSSYANEDIVIISNANDSYVTSANSNEPVSYLIKRIIACPGDIITFYVTNYESGTFYYDILVKDCNGNSINLNDLYLSEDMKFTYGEFLTNKIYYETYNKIFSELAKSTADNYTTYTLTVNENEYFVMGDNRNHSEDSRYFGTVTVNSISGKVILQVPYGSNIWQSLWLKLKEQF